MIGIPALYYQRRQTRLAELAQESLRAESVKEQRIDVLARVRANKKLRVGIVHYPPFASIPGDEEPGGLYVDLLRAFCAAEGIL